MKNVIIEILRNEDSEVVVSECGLGDYGWLWCVMGEGGFKEFDLDLLDEELNKFKEEEGEWIDEGVDFDEKKKEFVDLVKKNMGDDVNFVGSCSFSVECDGSFVVLICKL